jgi:heme-degrading monooxygenase HmoA
MVARLWTTGLNPERVAAYEVFARDVSLPMFRAADGFLGCIMSRSGDRSRVLTIWRDQDAVNALARSPAYQTTVSRILAAGLLAGEQSTDVMDVHLLEWCQLV